MRALRNPGAISLVYIATAMIATEGRRAQKKTRMFWLQRLQHLLILIQMPVIVLLGDDNMPRGVVETSRYRGPQHQDIRNSIPGNEP
jgi:hypothetical protein